MPTLEIRDLKKQFGSATALDGLSFTVEPGQIVGLLGPNGAGKTTLIQILLGLVTRTSGSVSVFGLDPEKQRVEVLQRCNFSSAYVNLPQNLSVEENLSVFAGLYQVRGVKAKIAALLTMFEAENLGKKMTGKLSSGEAARINLCKALLNDPELLLLDEPTASLDPDIADKVRKLLLRVRTEQKTTILYTSHNMRDIEEVCDRIVFIHKGKLIADDTPSAIKAQFHQTSLEGVFISIARGETIAGEAMEEHS